MKAFEYVRPAGLEEALDVLAERPGARPLGGGTNLVDLMREEIEQPAALVDVTRLGLDGIEAGEHAVSVGAGVRNSALAADPAVRTRLPLVSRALLSGASGQLRNMATVGGNLMQRTRCLYFYDTAAACNRRTPGAGCDAREGFHRAGAILGAGEHCLAVHPSDLCVALAATDAQVHVRSARGQRRIPLRALHRTPGETPEVETVLGPDELICSVEIPYLPEGCSSTYRKVRDRASYAFALVSVAAVLRVQDGQVAQVRLALGGVATVPWRAVTLEEELLGRPATAESFEAAARVELEQARPTEQLEFKVGLARRTITAVLGELAREQTAATTGQEGRA